MDSAVACSLLSICSRKVPKSDKARYSLRSTSSSTSTWLCTRLAVLMIRAFSAAADWFTVFCTVSGSPPASCRSSCMACGVKLSAVRLFMLWFSCWASW